jgi:cytochrome c biogenesis protein CcmG/thiol:disulfide interchange protein DsbE
MRVGEKTNFCIILVLLLLVLSGCDMDVTPGNNPGAGSDTLVGKPAPAFAMETLDGDREGTPYHKGEPMVITFWGSWCGQCKKEAPALAAAYAAFRERGVVFIGVVRKDTPENAMAFMKQYGLSYKNGFDTSEDLSTKYQVAGIPKTIFIDKNGMVSYTHLGPISESILTREIKKIL